ncbi:MAG TPA: NADH-ubiquinone oxidoreductase-F iron-sulfur binding region domain-containing protein [Syntrophorhabdaceae bacterium]|nr:NADH-ubiquinone oxidoreductase-F iron-sulfur binding region domain-containing protein [Syntrophorhabdaceae bacterium]HQE80880.1 NADH-ubiquinone oxidoreductase-F iron-sulfur binding region domain-containing protein [Syntrophorhabdaceae bacterium]HQH44008.1 NADH-ubiquinone oxidoreductase-F iron-sulfur binding region domain-containing protein [Syntrophorhabdaceae bacterium]HQK46713.1 NADH-ubiquinone oxidoreductase-F iron-sulfur binding region domain-containing protein [Syntrophorhabdaceae bacter
MNWTLMGLKKIKKDFNTWEGSVTHRVLVCAGTGCLVNGSMKVYDEFIRVVQDSGLNAIVELKKEEEGIFISKSGCQGFCQIGPLVTILPENILYTKVKPGDVQDIVETTLKRGEILHRLLYIEPNMQKVCKGQEDIPFYQKQCRFVLNTCGLIDPEDIREYISRGGYLAAAKACSEMTPEEVCRVITESGIRGRGGGGFPTGKKWDTARLQTNEKKYVICNGDEGDPGAFMDMGVMEGNPHSVIEGMIIASWAIGADEGYVYVRAEYPLAVKRIRKAIKDAYDLGILGKRILGSEHTFNLQVMEGAGAFVCGEETALIASIEGKRGMPSPKPPFPAESGLWGRPTIINNVETLSTIPLIIGEGVERFRQMGTDTSPGTKTFAITGHVLNTGLIEMPLGVTLREIIYGVAGGITGDDGKAISDGFKAAQIGGPSGGCLTTEHLDLPIDFDSLKKVGAMVGSGGLVIMNKNTCMVSVARFFMQFTQSESCGKCVLCREGTKQMLAILDDIMEGRATEDTLELLEDLAVAVQKGSLCGLGKTAPNPVLSTLKNFREEYEAHVKYKYCPTGKCKALTKFTIDQELCKGCTLCANKCPVGAITGQRKKPHRIDPLLCIRCGACIESCAFEAIKGEKI